MTYEILDELNKFVGEIYDLGINCVTNHRPKKLVSTTDCDIQDRLTPESRSPGILKGGAPPVTDAKICSKEVDCSIDSPVADDPHTRSDTDYMLSSGRHNSRGSNLRDSDSDTTVIDNAYDSHVDVEFVPSSEIAIESSNKVEFLTSIRDFIMAIIETPEQPSVDVDPPEALLIPHNIPGVDGLDFQSLKSKIIETIDRLAQLDLEISVLQDSHDSYSATFQSLSQSYDAMEAENTHLRSKLDRAESRNRELSFRLNHVLQPTLNELIFEKQSMEQISHSQSEATEIEAREIEILQSQLIDRHSIIQSYEDDIENLRAKIAKIVPVETTSFKSNNPLHADLHACLCKIEVAHKDSLAKFRNIRTECARLEQAIWLKTETRLKPTLDRIVSLEIENERNVFEQKVIEKTISELLFIGKKLESQYDLFETERADLSEKTRIANEELREMNFIKSNLVASIVDAETVETDSRKSLRTEQSELQRITCERNEAIKLVEVKVSELKQNIVEISCLKERVGKMSESTNTARNEVAFLTKSKQEWDDKLAELSAQNTEELSVQSERESVVRVKQAEIENLEESVRRTKIKLNENRRKLDISKLEIAKFRSIGSRVLEAKSKHEELIAERREKEARLRSIVELNKTKPNANISEIFVLTTESVDERIKITENRFVKCHERLRDLKSEVDEMEIRKKELEEKTRKNILFIQKISKLKLICMHLNRQVIAREAEIIVYNSRCDELQNRLTEKQEPVVLTTKKSNLSHKPKKDEPKESEPDDWLGVIVR